MISGARTVEIVVSTRQVGVEGVEVGRLLDAIPNRLQLIGKVLAASVGPASPKRNVRSAHGVQRLKGRTRDWCGSAYA
jgi:hypothetical protein